MKIKEKLRAYGILVIRMFWPGKGSKGVQKLGILILGIGAMMGITQAGEIQKLVSGALAADQTIKAGGTPPLMSRNLSGTAAVTSVPATADANVNDQFSSIPNIVDLVGDSESIVRGVVEDVSDGIENGVPYTQVTLSVTESIRGDVGEKYTFRQFGLVAPKKMGNGKVNLNVTPAGWATYGVGEDVLLFLYEPARLTGLQTTTGLGQGKLTLKGGNAESGFNNVGLFENVEVDQKELNDRDKRVFATKRGPVNAESLLSVVRKAVKGRWVEGGKLRHAKK